MEDKDIIDLFLEGSETAIRELDIKYRELLKRFLWNILKNYEDTEECLNKTYLKVWHSITGVNPDNLKAYVYKIARNEALDNLKYNMRQKRCAEIEMLLSELDECIPGKANVEENLNKEETVRIINNFVSNLDELSQTLFVRRYWMMDSINVLSKEYKLSKPIISDKLYRIRVKLKKYLEGEGIYI